MKKLRLLSLVGITSIILAQADGPLPRALVQEVPVVVVLLAEVSEGFNHQQRIRLKPRRRNQLAPASRIAICAWASQRR